MLFNSKTLFPFSRKATELFLNLFWWHNGLIHFVYLRGTLLKMDIPLTKASLEEIMTDTAFL